MTTRQICDRQDHVSKLQLSDPPFPPGAPPVNPDPDQPPPIEEPPSPIPIPPDMPPPIIEPPAPIVAYGGPS